ncbi:zf-C2HC5-domain-containing protein [Saccharata proteae CBS 121410]|uniref:Zf-C2HC5-domain-containing protein n=1 Tax=Saccharata proteae CBS 121410 TaxID=1314787 RepID=A0A9P4HNI0_9PEZI|nr:zf-C2HC5-domain-containing protein [Saccharata proteae CBS 121410]
MELTAWSRSQLSRLLPMDNDSLDQIIRYTDTLPPESASDHLMELLGDSPAALEFISSFNSRRAPAPSQNPASTRNQNRNDASEVPKPRRGGNKQKKPIHNLPARRPEDFGNTSGAYMKRDEDDYMPTSSRTKKEPPLSNSLALQEKPDAKQLPSTRTGPNITNPTAKLPPSAAGPLISDLPNVKNKSSRTSSPAPRSQTPKTKITVAGGANMHGQASTLNDLDSAIRALEIQIKPSLSNISSQDMAKRRCNCMATRHPLLTAAPNCLSCGKIICVKEGLGPCTFCEKPLLSASEIESMVHILKEERGKERMNANNASQKRAEVSNSKGARPFAALAAPGALSTPGSSQPSSAPDSDAEEAETLRKAKEHRDRLLAFQANNAKRTRVHDEAADFETPDAGVSQWASPAERALQLKRQQKILREQEWNARPEYEKRQMVASIDVASGKVMRKMAKVQRPVTPESEDDIDEPGELEPQEKRTGKGGAFSRNPLLGAMIRPVAKAEGDGKGKEREREKGSMWRRVQDDRDDNEEWILDGGAYGGRIDGRVLGAEEHAVG